MKKIICITSFLILYTSIMTNTVMSMNSNENSDIKQSHQSFAPMLEIVMPSVVSINVEGNTTIRSPKLPQYFFPFFGKNSPLCQDDSPFKSSPMCQENIEESDNHQQKFHILGSGVIIDAEKGYIVTNNHVVDNANNIQVQTSDGRKYEAKLIGHDPRSDIALIQLKEFKNLKAIKLADSDNLRVGDYAVAIGNPYGFGETVTSGIISALGRSGLNSENYENFIQTDAAINRGNSGGALVNLSGELIGINTAIFAPDGGNIGIGFAIPSNMVKNLTTQMVEHGKVQRGELGILGTELSSELSKAMKIDAQRGAFVSQVFPNSSADKAGIQAGDIIVSLNNKPVTSFSVLRAQLATLPVGSKIELGLLRNEKKLLVTAIIQPIKNKKNTLKSHLEDIFLIEGAVLNNYHSKDFKCVQVESVQPHSMATRIGLRKNDLILSVNKEPIKNLSDLRKIFEAKNALLVLHIKRDSQNIYLLLQ